MLEENIREIPFLVKESRFFDESDIEYNDDRIVYLRNFVNKLLQEGLENCSDKSLIKSMIRANSIDLYLYQSSLDDEKSPLNEKEREFLHSLRNFLDRGENKGHYSVVPRVLDVGYISELIKIIDENTLILVDKKLEVEQLFYKLKDIFPNKKIGKKHGSYFRRGEEIIIMTYSSFLQEQSKTQKNPYLDPNNFQFVVLQGVHHAETLDRAFSLNNLSHALQIGITAKSRFQISAATPLVIQNEIESMIKPLDAVEENCIHQTNIITVKTDTDISSIRVNSSGAYDDKQLDVAINVQSKNEATVKIVDKLCRGESGIINRSSIIHSESIAKEFNAIPQYYIDELNLSDEQKIAIWPTFLPGAVNKIESKRAFAVLHEAELHILLANNNIAEDCPQHSRIHNLWDSYRRAEAIHSRLPFPIQRSILDRHKNGDFPVLVNVDSITEFYSNPLLKFCINIDPTHSYLQCFYRSGLAWEYDEANQTEMRKLFEFQYETTKSIKPMSILKILDGAAGIFKDPSVKAGAIDGDRAEAESLQRNIIYIADMEVTVVPDTIKALKKLEKPPSKWRPLRQYLNTLGVNEDQIDKLIPYLKSIFGYSIQRFRTEKKKAGLFLNPSIRLPLAFLLGLENEEIRKRDKNLHYLIGRDHKDLMEFERFTPLALAHKLDVDLEVIEHILKTLEIKVTTKIIGVSDSNRNTFEFEIPLISSAVFSTLSDLSDVKNDRFEFITLEEAEEKYGRPLPDEIIELIKKDVEHVRFCFAVPNRLIQGFPLLITDNYMERLYQIVKYTPLSELMRAYKISKEEILAILEVYGEDIEEVGSGSYLQSMFEDHSSEYLELVDEDFVQKAVRYSEDHHWELMEDESQEARFKDSNLLYTLFEDENEPYSKVREWFSKAYPDQIKKYVLHGKDTHPNRENIYHQQLFFLIYKIFLDGKSRQSEIAALPKTIVMNEEEIDKILNDYSDHVTLYELTYIFDTEPDLMLERLKTIEHDYAELFQEVRTIRLSENSTITLYPLGILVQLKFLDEQGTNPPIDWKQLNEVSEVSSKSNITSLLEIKKTTNKPYKYLSDHCFVAGESDFYISPQLTEDISSPLSGDVPEKREDFYSRYEPISISEVIQFLKRSHKYNPNKFKAAKEKLERSKKMSEGFDYKKEGDEIFLSEFGLNKLLKAIFMEKIATRLFHKFNKENRS